VISTALLVPIDNPVLAVHLPTPAVRRLPSTAREWVLASANIDTVIRKIERIDTSALIGTSGRVCLLSSNFPDLPFME
jgi:hypothetical protein